MCIASPGEDKGVALLSVGWSPEPCRRFLPKRDDLPSENRIPASCFLRAAILTPRPFPVLKTKNQTRKVERARLIYFIALSGPLCYKILFK